MSTILKALRRLEEDKPPKATSSEAAADAKADAVPADNGAANAPDQAAGVAATPESVVPARPPEANPPVRRAPTDPRATDELRERILAEERASEVARTDRSRVGSRERGEAIAARASISETPTPAPDPFANRVVEPAFTPPSSATLAHTQPGMDSASPSSASAEGSGVLSRGLMVGALGLGVAVVFLAGFLYSGQGGQSDAGEARVAANEIAGPASASRSTAVAATEVATEVVTEVATEAPIGAEPTRAAAQVASASIPSAYAPAAPVRPMTVTRSKVAPRPEAPRQAAAPKPRPAPRVAPVVEPAPAEPSTALSRAAVTPTRAAREAIREPIPQAPADPSAVASRPRPQTFPGERARVSAAVPTKSPAPTAPVQVAATVKTAPVEELPMAELAPSRSARALPETTSTARIVPEATTRAGAGRPSEKPAAAIKTVTSSPRPSSAPEVKLVESRGLPDLTVIRTSWHPTSDRRSAKIRLEEQNELVTLREGDSVGEMTIHEISPSAVVFSAGQVQIRRRVGEAPSGR